MADQVSTYIGNTDVKDVVISHIAPLYFDFADVNQYQVGTFGLITELFSTMSVDSFNAISVSRREFYPHIAKFESSIYEMATLQKVDFPIATAGKCNAILLLIEREVLEAASTNATGVKTFMLDNTVKLWANEVPFALDYPIEIRATPKAVNGYNYIIRYKSDTEPNSLADKENVAPYLPFKIAKYNNSSYIYIGVTLRQLEPILLEEVVHKDGFLETFSIDFEFEGQLAGFDVFNIVGSNDPIHLSVMNIGSSYSSTPFCHYEFINSQKVRLTFPKNPYYTPMFNSTIQFRAYVTLGKNGNFKKYDGDLLAEIHSERWSYNDTTFLTGQINGSCSGGLDIPNFDGFRQKVINAYSTNNVITTYHDLQIKFDDILDSLGLSKAGKISFIKKRDDPLLRLYGGYMLFKDPQNNVIPTNSLQTQIRYSASVTPDMDPSDPLVITPGSLFEYIADDSFIVKRSAYNMFDDIEEIEKSQFLFASPFLTVLYSDPEIVAYYLNSANYVRPTEYTYINDESEHQFIGNRLSIERNALLGENFYNVSIQVRPVDDLAYDNFISFDQPVYVYSFTFNGGTNYTLGDVLTCEIFEFTVTELDANMGIVKADVNINHGFDLYDFKNKVLEGGTGTGAKASIISYDIINTYRAPMDGIVREHKLDKLPIWMKKEEIQKWSTFSGIEVPKGTLVYSEDPSFSDWVYIAKDTFIADISESVDLSSGNWDQLYPEWLPDTDYGVDDKYVFVIDGGICTLYYKLTSNAEYYNNPTFSTTLDKIYPYTLFEYKDGTAEIFITHNSVELEAGSWNYITGWKMEFLPTEKFVKGDLLAIKRPTDLGTLRAMFDIPTILGINQLFMPMVIDDYSESDGVPTYTFSTQFSTTDIVGLNGRIKIPYGIFNDQSVLEPDFALPIKDIMCQVNLFYRNPTYNPSHQYSGYIYFDGLTHTNTYGQNTNDSSQALVFIKPIDYCRSTMTYIDVNDTRDDYTIDISKLLLCKASWITDSANFNYLISTFEQENDLIEREIYTDLENNYSVDLAFYNTYGKPKYFKIGSEDNLTTLDNVQCSFRFGIKLSSISNTDTFLSQFRTYIKDKVEAINARGEIGQYIFVMNLISEAKQNFPDIEYMEYYGINSFKHDAQKIIGMSLENIEFAAAVDYIPEFININSILDGSSYRPDIDVKLLSDSIVFEEDDETP